MRRTNRSKKRWAVKRVHVRPEVAQFAIEMEMVLRENDHKTGWDEMSYHQIFERIKREFEELQREYILYANSKDSMNRDGSSKGLTRMREEAIDIANFCMFFCHNYQPRTGQEHTYSAEALDALGEVMTTDRKHAAKKRWLIRLTGEDNLFYDSEERVYRFRMHCPYCGKVSGCQCYQELEDAECDEANDLNYSCSAKCSLVSGEWEGIDMAMGEVGLTGKNVEDLTEDEAKKVLDIVTEECEAPDAPMGEVCKKG